jgi:hypothetical protein
MRWNPPEKMVGTWNRKNQTKKIQPANACIVRQSQPKWQVAHGVIRGDNDELPQSILDDHIPFIPGMIPVMAHPIFVVGHGGVLGQFRMDEGLFWILYQKIKVLMLKIMIFMVKNWDFKF